MGMHMSSAAIPTFELSIILTDVEASQEAGALLAFTDAFADTDLVVRDSGLRTLLQSAEPPLRFAIELVTHYTGAALAIWVANQLGSMTMKALFQPTIDRLVSGGKGRFAQLWGALRKRFPNRRIQVELSIPRTDGEVIYSLPGPDEADEAVAAIPKDLERVETAGGNDSRYWENGRWHGWQDALDEDEGRLGD
jgi:hypothetical protein